MNNGRQIDGIHHGFGKVDEDLGIFFSILR